MRDSAFPSSSAFSRVSVAVESATQDAATMTITTSTTPAASKGTALLEALNHSSVSQDIESLLTNPMERFHATTTTTTATAAVLDTLPAIDANLLAPAISTSARGTDSVKVLVDEESALASRLRLLARMLTTATLSTDSASPTSTGGGSVRKVTAESWAMLGEAATSILATKRQSLRRRRRQTNVESVTATTTVRHIPEARDIAAVGGFGSRDLGVARRIELAL